MYIKSFWNNIAYVFENNINNLKYFVIGYKTKQPYYNTVNKIVGLIVVCYKAYFASDCRTKKCKLR